MLAAEGSQALEEVLIAGIDAAFALEGLNQNGGDGRTVGFPLLEQGFKRFDVVVREVVESIDQGLETLVVPRLAGGGDRGEGAAVEAR